MKYLSAFTKLLFMTYLTSCSITDSDESEPQQELRSNQNRYSPEIISEIVVFSGDEHIISYFYDQDSVVQFVDERSERSYDNLQSFLGMYDSTFSAFIPANEEKIYYFRNSAALTKFHKDRIGRKGSVKLISRAYSQDHEENIEAKTEHKKDSNNIKHRFIEHNIEHVGKQYGLGQFGSKKLPENAPATSTNSTLRERWHPDAQASKISLYDNANFGGASVEVINPSFIYYEATRDHWNEYIVSLSLLGFNDKTNSMKVSNASTRYMVARFWQDGYNSGNVLDIELRNRLNSGIPTGYISDLREVKVKHTCIFFCNKWDNEISTVSFFWYIPLDWVSPIFSGTKNTDVLVPVPYAPNQLTLRKVSTATSWWNAGASSPVKFGEIMEFEIDSKETNYMVGFSKTSDNDVSWNTIDYNLYVSDYNGDKILIYENGTYRFTYPGTYRAGDIISIVKDIYGGPVAFFHNSVFIGQLDSKTSGYLYFDCSIYTPGAEIKDISIWPYID